MIVRSRGNRFDPFLAAEIGRRVRATRLDRGWSTYRLSAHTGLSRSMIQDVEWGRSLPGSAVVLLLADALATSPNHILGWEDKHANDVRS